VWNVRSASSSLARGVEGARPPHSVGCSGHLTTPQRVPKGALVMSGVGQRSRPLRADSESGGRVTAGLAASSPSPSRPLEDRHRRRPGPFSDERCAPLLCDARREGRPTRADAREVEGLTIGALLPVQREVQRPPKWTSAGLPVLLGANGGPRAALPGTSLSQCLTHTSLRSQEVDSRSFSDPAPESRWAAARQPVTGTDRRLGGPPHSRSQDSGGEGGLDRPADPGGRTTVWRRSDQRESLQ
jgi:hypothetical protein